MSHDVIERYTGTAMLLHWLTAANILVLLGLGFIMTGMPDGNIELKFTLYQLHKSFGILLLLITLVRLGWRIKASPPAPIISGWMLRAASLTHWALYAIMIMMPIVGWMMVSASPLQIPTEIFGLVELPHLPLFDSGVDRKALEHLFEEIHESMAFVLIGILVLHVGAALYHHLVRKDATLVRMTPGAIHKN
ncbi:MULTISPECIES: cytochrome b [Kordiimonas]|jgi:cytochrome b561|uniref:cytochrome b n=1 Tax=Kordiimonas TaxID=288021 RepID=UPI00257F3283|nr:cytochrome b [Kordiimonas sp. UBA4487]